MSEPHPDVAIHRPEGDSLLAHILVRNSISPETSVRASPLQLTTEKNPNIVRLHITRHLCGHEPSGNQSLHQVVSTGLKATINGF